MTQRFAHAAASRALGCVRGRVEAAATGALENNERLPILWSPGMHSTTLRFLASQTTLPQEPTDLQALPHLQYTARPGMLIKDAQLTTPFCLSPTDTADASCAPAEQMIPLADAVNNAVKTCA